MDCLSHARKSALRPPTSSLPAARWVPLKSQTPQIFLDGSCPHTAEPGRIETAAIWLLPSQEVGLHGFCVYTDWFGGFDYQSKIQNKKPHSVRGSQLSVTVVGLECVPPAPYTYVLQSPKVIEGPAVLRSNCPGGPARRWCDASPD